MLFQSGYWLCRAERAREALLMLMMLMGDLIVVQTWRFVGVVVLCRFRFLVEVLAGR